MNLREECRKAAEQLMSVKGEPTVLWQVQIEEALIEIAVKALEEFECRLEQDGFLMNLGDKWRGDNLKVELKSMIQELKGESDG